MARKLQIKRGLQSKLPALADGEFGLTTDQKKLYVGCGGNVRVATDADITALNNSLNVLNMDEVNIYIAPTGNDVTGDGTQTKPYLTLKKAFECIPQQLYKKYSVVIQDGHYLYGSIGKTFNGNGGSISIIGASRENTILVGHLFIVGDFELNIKNINFKHGKLTDAQVNLQKCHGDIDNCIFDSIDKTKAWNFMSALGAMFWISNCTFKNASSGYVCGGGGSFIYFMKNNTFDNCDIAIRAINQVIVQNYIEPQYINCAQKYTTDGGGLTIDASGSLGITNAHFESKDPATNKSTRFFNAFGNGYMRTITSNDVYADLILNSADNPLYNQLIIHSPTLGMYKIYGEHNITVSQSPPATTLTHGCMHNVY